MANLIIIKIKKVLVEAHNSVGLVKRYYISLQYAYEIIQNKLKGKYINKEIILQMAVKAINNLIKFNKIIPTLLVFSTYLQLTKIDPLSLSVIKRIEAICIAIKEVRRLYTKRQVKNILTIHNSLDTKITLDLPLQSNIRVWRKKEG